MDYIRKLPLLLGLSSAIIVGLVGYTNKLSNSENTVKMLISMVIFYIVGCLIRNTITSIVETNRKKREEKEKEEKRLEELKKKEEEKQKREAEKNKGKTLDLVAGDDIDLNEGLDDFDSLPVADFIKSELNKENK